MNQVRYITLRYEDSIKGILRPVERIVSERIRKAGEEEAGGNADNRPLRGGSFNDDFTMKARRR